MFHKLAPTIAVVLVCGSIARPADPVSPRITTPKQQFGFNLGDDYQLINYEQYADYLGKLVKESDRIKVVTIGDTAEKRSQFMRL